MSLPTATLDGEAVTILSVDPHWDRMSFEHEFRTLISASLSARESRRRRWLAMRSRSSISYLFDERSEAADFRTMLATIGKGIIAQPIWPDQRAAETWSESYYDAQYLLRLDTLAITAKADVDTLPAGTEVVPLIFGHLTKRPSITPLDEARCEVVVEIFERCRWEWRVEIRDDGSTPGAFPDMEPNWSGELEDTSDDYLEYEEIGDTRETLIKGDEAPMKWGQSADFLLDTPEQVHAMLAFFGRCAGAWGKFTCPVWFRPHPQASEETPDGIVGRLASDILRISWSTTQIADVRMDIWQLPWELNPPEGEAFELPSEANLYRVTYHVPHYFGGPLLYRYTDSDRPVTYEGEIYEPYPIQYDTIEGVKQFSSESTAITAGAIDGSPFLRLWRGEASAQMMLEIFECDPTDADDTAELIFDGWLGSPEKEDREITVEAGDGEPPELPRIVVSREGVNFPEELWQVRVGKVVNITDGDTKVWLDWLDADRWQNPEDWRLNGWIMRRDYWGNEKISTHFREAEHSGLTDAAFVLSSAWPALTIGDEVYLMSPYIRRGTVTKISDDGFSAYAQKYHVDWTDGLGSPETDWFSGGFIEGGDGENYESRAIQKHFGNVDEFDAAFVTRLPLSSIEVGDPVIVAPGWDMTYSQLSERFPLARDHAVLFPYTPYRNPLTETRNPFAKVNSGGKK